MPLQTETLTNGLVVNFFDRSNRYFGDYWCVRVEVRCPVPVDAAGLDAEEIERVRAEVGDTIEYVRQVERMGVPTDDLPRVRQGLIDGFLATSGRYLADRAFLGRLVASRVAEIRNRRRPFLVRK